MRPRHVKANKKKKSKFYHHINLIHWVRFFWGKKKEKKGKEKRAIIDTIISTITKIHK
jgi:hypothetical protein